MKKQFLFILTGGTGLQTWSIKKDIMHYDTATEVQNYIKQKIDADLLQIEVPFLKESGDVTNDDRQTILDLILNSECQNVVIIHGTNTAKQTSDFLLEKLPQDCGKKFTIIGAHTPFVVIGSDMAGKIDKAIESFTSM